MGLDQFLFRKAKKQIGGEVGYWRKANHIHRWFVQECQDGIDECQYSNDITPEKLKQLKGLCEQVLADHDKAEELLPTQGGFFFGGTSYDEWYFESLEETIGIIDDATAGSGTDDFVYCSSW